MQSISNPKAEKTIMPHRSDASPCLLAASLPGSNELASRKGGTVSQQKIQDPIAFQRYEYKYLIPADLMGPIRSFISPYCDMDPFVDREDNKFYTIRTLYLDSADYKTHWDKEHEVPNRFKLRVRTYGKTSDDPVKFEVKRRINDIFLKSSVVVPREIWPGLLTAPINGFSRSFTQEEMSALNSFLWLTRTLRATPKMLIQYERQAFRSRIDRYVRISFDRRICHQPKSTYDLTGQAAAWLFNDDPKSMGEASSLAVLELKFTAGVPLWLSDMVCRFRLVRRGFSKYCTAVARTMNGELAARDLSQAVPTARLIGRKLK
jgi:hypothetical protein